MPSHLLLIPFILISILNLVCNSEAGSGSARVLNFCESQSDCGDFMICLDNACICDEEEEASFSDSSSHEQKNNKNRFLGSPCKGLALVGDNCDNNLICAGGSICSTQIKQCICPVGFEVQNYTRECRVSYGFSCGEDNDKQLCNPDKFLSCSEEHKICICAHSQSQSYDPIKQTCVSKVGHPCELSSAEDWMGIQMECGDFATCTPHDDTDQFYGSCSCQEGFRVDHIDNDTTKCISSIGAFCNQGSDCGHLDGDLECVDHSCTCKSSHLLHDNPTDVYCSWKANSKCNATDVSIGRGKCVANALCVDGICHCDPLSGFTLGDDGRCKLSYGHQCSSPLECHTGIGLICTYGRCECSTGFKYDPKRGLCLGLNATKCLTLDDCANNYECHTSLKICKCKDTFHLNRDGDCEVGFGTTCADGTLVECPKSKGFHCNNESKRCDCEGEKIFDKLMGECRLRVGEDCSYPHKMCIRTAFCGTGDKCQCYSQYTPTPDKDCLLGLDQYCFESKIQCNSHIGLECGGGAGGKCQCEGEKMYNDIVDKCVETEIVTYNSIVVHNYNKAADGVNNERQSDSKARKESSPSVVIEQTSGSIVLLVTIVFSLLILFLFTALILLIKSSPKINANSNRYRDHA